MRGTWSELDRKCGGGEIHIMLNIIGHQPFSSMYFVVRQAIQQGPVGSIAYAKAGPFQWWCLFIAVSSQAELARLVLKTLNGRSLSAAEVGDKGARGLSACFVRCFSVC